jgi:hypothetical protein
MGNNVFQSPFNITSAAINAALAGATLAALNLNAGQTGWIGWSSRAVMRSPSDGELSLRNFAETIQVSQVVEANDIIAQRRGTNAQTSRIYNTFTDASNYERGHLQWSSNILELATAAAGTGSSRNLRLNGGGTFVDITTNDVQVYRNGTSAATILSVLSTGLTNTAILHTRLAPGINQASGTYCVLDINPTETAIGAGPHYLIRGRIGGGGDVFNVQKNGDIVCGALTMGGNVITMTERADPGNSSADQGRLYLRDNGSGKTQLCVVFSSGAVQVLATQP